MDEPDESPSTASADTIVVVSGLPRSGTSLMMQMLVRAGLEALTDGVRAADLDNPHGYFEFEPVKQTRRDPAWVPRARGKAVKLVSSLLYDLPPSEAYRVVFMRREMDEMLASQEKMLQRMGRTSAPREKLRTSFTAHLEKLFAWIETQAHLRVHEVSYNRLLADPTVVTAELASFVGLAPHPERMIDAIDPSLYRNRGG